VPRLRLSKNLGDATLVFLIAVAILPATAWAHVFTFTDVSLELHGERYEVSVACDLDALALGVPSTADSAVLAAQIEGLPAQERDQLVARLVRLLKRRLRVRFDGERDDFAVNLPGRGQPPLADQPPG